MAPSTPTFTLRSILEKDKLNGANYIDWIRNLRIVLRVEKKEEVLDTPLLEEPACWGLVLKCYELRTRQHRKC